MPSFPLFTRCEHPQEAGLRALRHDLAWRRLSDGSYSLGGTSTVETA